MANEVENTKPKNEIALVRQELDIMMPQFAKALPAHIPVERFERVVMTAIQNNPDLINSQKCTRRSLWNACMKAAQDGLLPDGREGAIVPYKGQASWLPMIFGIRKKVRNSGEIKDWDVQLVYENDHFEHEMGSSKYIRHRRFMGAGNRGPIVGGYSIAEFKDGGMSFELMSIDEIEAVRKQASRATSDKSPWNVAAYYGEMCRKTIAKRHSKTLPMSSDLDDLIRQDDELYDLKGAAEEQAPRRRQLGQALDALVDANNGNTASETPTEEDRSNPADHDEKTGEVHGDDKPKDDKKPAEAESTKEADKPNEDAGKKTAAKAAKAADKAAEPKLPSTGPEYAAYARGWVKTSANGKTTVGEETMTLKERWNSAAEKKIRNGVNITPELREEVFDELIERQRELEHAAE